MILFSIDFVMVAPGNKFLFGKAIIHHSRKISSRLRTHFFSTLSYFQNL